MADPYKFSFDVAAFLEEQEAADTSVAPKEGVMKKPEAPVEVAPMSNTDRLKKRFADTLSSFYSGTQEIRDKYNTAQETNPLFGRDAAQNDWIKALELSPITTTDMGPDMGTMAMQDAQEQSAIRSVSGITESRGRPQPTAMTDVAGLTAMLEGEADADVTLPSTDSVSDMYPTQGLMSPPVQDTVSGVDTTTAAAPVEDANVATYSVVSGDTLSKIAKANNTTVAELTAANPDIKDINKIDVGQEIKLPTVTAEEAVTEEVAAVTETVTDDTTTDLSTYTEDYAKVYLKEHEGLKAHKSLEGGKDTAAMGIKFSLGLKRTDYASDAEFAGAVSLKHRDKAKAKFKSETWDALPQSVKYAVTDLNFNNGTIGSTGNKATTEETMKNTLNYIGMTTKAKDEASLISLAKRRAWNWNKAASDMGVSEIAKIKQIPTTSGGTKFEYLASDGSVIHSVTTKRTPVKLDKAGTATTLTETRELTM